MSSEKFFPSRSPTSLGHWVDAMLIRVSGVTIVATCPRIFRLSFFALSARRQRWLWVNRIRRLPICSRRTRFSSTWCCRWSIQPAIETMRNENGSKPARIRRSLSCRAAGSAHLGVNRTGSDRGSDRPAAARLPAGWDRPAPRLAGCCRAGPGSAWRSDADCRDGTCCR